MSVNQIEKLCFLIVYLTSLMLTANNNIELSISSAQQTKMPIALIILDETKNELNEIAAIIKKDLEFTDQFIPSIKKYNQQLSKQKLRKNLQNLAQSGTPLAMCINAQSKDGVPQIDWYLYDTTQCTLLGSKRYKTKGSMVNKYAHTIADEIRKILTNNEPLFSSHIAYCKNVKNAQGRIVRQMCMADFDGSNEKLLIDRSTIIIAPRWHIKKPELFYSEYTDTNIQLKSINPQNKKNNSTQTQNISPFQEGINMLIDFAPNGQDYTFCASRGKGNCQIYVNTNNSLKQCTNNSGNNDSPQFMDNERICFCSDFQTGNPQMYIGNILTGHLQRITKGGYCTSPSYCALTNQIAYLMMKKGIMQIMLYDCTTKSHQQLTFDNGNKHEICWSPDGIYLLYSHENKPNSSRLQVFNTLTQKTKYITSPDDYCNYPHWSPNY